MKLTVWVQPGASRSRVAGYRGDVLKVSVSAPPEKGKANRAVCDLLAREFGVRRAEVRVTTGIASREKTLEISGLEEGAVREKLAEWRSER